MAAVRTPPPPPAPKPAGGTQEVGPGVIARTAANLRSGPSNSSTVLRVAQRGEDFRVYGYAVGGWVQVGHGEPLGWIHSSLLEESTP